MPVDKTTPPIRVGQAVGEVKKPRQVVTVRIKNRGSSPRIIYDTSLKPVKLEVGEAKSVEVSKKWAERVRNLSLTGGALIVLDASELGEPVTRVRVKGKGADTAVSKKAEKNKTKHGKTSKSSGKPAKVDKAKVLHPEIKTASGLLRVMQGADPLPYNHFKSVAFRVLPEGTLANGANKAAILKALESAVAKE